VTPHQPSPASDMSTRHAARVTTGVNAARSAPPAEPPRCPGQARRRPSASGPSPTVLSDPAIDAESEQQRGARGGGGGNPSH